MRPINVAIAVAMAPTLVATVATRYTGPGRWKNAPATQDACLARAEAAILGTGFSGIERTVAGR
jgi:hypothetical protein